MTHILKLIVSGVFASLITGASWNDLGSSYLKFMFWSGQFAITMSLIPEIFGE